MQGALLIRTARQLLQKLNSEFGEYLRDTTDSARALNVFRDAYHIREWLWQQKFKNDQALFESVFPSVPYTESNYNGKINSDIPNYQIIREVCNGSKHFDISSSNITAATGTGWDEAPWDTVPWDCEDILIYTAPNQHILVSDLLKPAIIYWSDLFSRHKL